jgi:two-component system, LytTR family, response regulator
MIRAIIIDDEPLARAIVKEYLRDFSQISIVQECGDGFEGIKAIQQHKPELVFLDVQMPKINGFEMLELIEDPPAVIFTTAFDEYAIQAFERHAVDYLLKPFSAARFRNAMERFLSQSNTGSVLPSLLNETTRSVQQERVVVKTAGKIKIIPLSEIKYFEAADDYVKIITDEGSFLKNKTLSYFETSLPSSQFVRTHRSYLVQVTEITRIEPYEKENHLAILRSGARIPVSRSGYAKLKAALGL